jgi:hypothetical protein
MMRPAEPGDVLHGGDIDNRMKTLFDALCVPKPEQIRRLSPESDDEKPFYCLLEDDSLVTSLQVKTERLLRPSELSDKHHESRVDLLIAVNVRPTRINGVNVGFLGDYPV